MNDVVTTKTRLKPIDLGSVSIGQPLKHDLFDEKGMLLLARGHVIDTDFQLYMLLKRGVYVEAEEALPTKSITSSSYREIFNPVLTSERSVVQLGRALRNQDGRAFYAQIEDLCFKMDYLANHHFDAAFAALMLTDPQKYPISHHLQTALVVAKITTRMQDMSENERLACIKASLTMNIGMLGLQTMLLSHQESLTDAQKKLIQQHPIESVRRLEALGIQEPLWLQIVLEHHEAPQGLGYPLNIISQCRGAEIVSLADIFCAKISHRNYRPGMPPAMAAKQLFHREGQKDPGSIASLLIREIGIYPAGSFVKLTNDEIGMVIKRGHTAGAPLVAVLYTDQDALPIESYPRPILRETTIAKYNIQTSVALENLKVPFNAAEIWAACEE